MFDAFSVYFVHSLLALGLFVYDYGVIFQYLQWVLGLQRQSFTNNIFPRFTTYVCVVYVFMSPAVIVKSMFRALGIN